jgi:hypothetical protein
VGADQGARAAARVEGVPRARPRTVGALIDAFLSDDACSHQFITESSLRAYGRRLEVSRRWVGESYPRALLTRQYCLELPKQMYKASYTRSYIKAVSGALRRCLEWAVDEGHLAANPMPAKLPRRRRRKMDGPRPDTHVEPG